MSGTVTCAGCGDEIKDVQLDYYLDVDGDGETEPYCHNCAYLGAHGRGPLAEYYSRVKKDERTPSLIRRVTRRS